MCVGAQPAGLQSPTTLAAIDCKRGRTASSSAASNHTIALSTSDDGSASRRAWLPSASHANDPNGSGLH